VPVFDAASEGLVYAMQLALTSHLASGGVQIAACEECPDEQVAPPRESRVLSSDRSFAPGGPTPVDDGLWFHAKGILEARFHSQVPNTSCE
jgi:hypothetical protein